VEAGAIDHLVDSQDPPALEAYRAMYAYDAAKLGQLLRDQPRLVQVRQNNGSTLLHEAAANGAPEIVTLLIDAAIEIDARNNEGQTALDRAISHNQIDAARQLIDSGAACDVFAVARCGATHRLGLMLDSDASLANATESGGLSVLRAAMMLGQKEVVRLLLGRGAADPAGLARQFCDGKMFDNQKLAGTLFRNVNLAGSVFQNVNLRNSIFHYLDLRDVTIDYAGIDGLRIFGVEVAPLVEAELARRRGH
jgi:ankyrin repeat protein